MCVWLFFRLLNGTEDVVFQSNTNSLIFECIDQEGDSSNGGGASGRRGSVYQKQEEEVEEEETVNNKNTSESSSTDAAAKIDINSDTSSDITGDSDGDTGNTTRRTKWKRASGLHTSLFSAPGSESKIFKNSGKALTRRRST